jgi:hypothetical protein
VSLLIFPSRGDWVFLHQEGVPPNIITPKMIDGDIEKLETNFLGLKIEESSDDIKKALGSSMKSQFIHVKHYITLHFNK